MVDQDPVVSAGVGTLPGLVFFSLVIFGSAAVGYKPKPTSFLIFVAATSLNALVGAMLLASGSVMSIVCGTVLLMGIAGLFLSARVT